MIRKRDQIILKVEGGLGNQLFQYSAGKFFSNSLGKTLVVDLRNVSATKLKRQPIIEKFVAEILGEKNDVFINNTYANYRRVVLSVLTRTRILQFISRRKNTYHSKVIGFDRDFIPNDKIRFLNGHFQTFRYAEKIIPRDAFKNFDINPNLNSILQSHDLDSTVAVHVRGRDYLNHKDTIGLLNERYYKTALSRACGDSTKNILVITDDHDYADELFKLTDCDYQICEEPKNASPLDIMHFLSKFNYLIIGNSTFAWWGAYFGDCAKTVYFPQTWFINLPQPVDITPKNWIPIESSWAI